MPDQVHFFPGELTEHPEPLSRYLPLVAESIAPVWLEENLPPGSWILDPFGMAPRLTCEMARAGYRVLVVSNNPIIRFLHELAANPPSGGELQSTLADVSISPRGDQRLEPYIRSLYQTDTLS